MARTRLSLESHFSETELKARYLRCSDAVAKTHWQVIWLLSRSDKRYSAEAVGDLVGFSADWVRKLIRRYNAQGAVGLGDHRQQNGAILRLSSADQTALKESLGSRPSDGGLWSGPKVARWIWQRCGFSVSDVTGWHYLNRLGLSLQTPRRRHDQAASPDEQASFKKTSGRSSRTSTSASGQGG